LSSDGEEELAEVAEHCLVFELGNPAVEVIQGRADRQQRAAAICPHVAGTRIPSAV
jgi:hypothetical protein